MPDSPRPVQGRQSLVQSGSPTDKPEWNRDIKAYYDAIASEPIPDEIQKLMATLSKAIRK